MKANPHKTELTPKQVALQWAAAYNNHDADAAAAIYDDNIVNLQHPWGTSIQGHEAMRSTYLKVFQAFPDIHVDVENLLEAGSWIAVEWRFRGTMRGTFAGHPPNNASFDLRGCEVFQIRDGVIVVQHGYWDKATLFSQLRIKPV